MTARASIIIVSFNNFDSTTGPCLESLVADPGNARHQIIVVDNCSTDGTREKLVHFGKKYPQILLKLNATNRGYAGGNNDGVAVAEKDICILLNSDTVVPPGAISRLTTLVGRHQGEIMLGPVTNQAGNEQKIFTTSTTVNGVLAEGKKWCDNAGPGLYPSQRLDFFCVAMPKRLYRQLGGLDESFGRGYYEDTDFSVRAKISGFGMYMTEEVFAFHRAGTSFSACGRDTVSALMKENKKKLLQKHPQGVALQHMRDVNLQVMEKYLLEKKNSEHNVGLLFRFENRLKLAQQQYPKNPVKKMKYHLRLRRVCRLFSAHLQGV